MRVPTIRPNAAQKMIAGRRASFCCFLFALFPPWQQAATNAGTDGTFPDVFSLS